MINLNKIKGVIFDLDGVLVDTEYYQSQAWIEVLRTYNISLSRGDCFHYKGKSGEVIEAELKKKYRLNIKKGELRHKRDELILKFFKKEKIKLMPYSKIALNFFSRKYKKIAIASTGFKDEVILKLKKSGLFHYFSTIVSRDEVKRGKPYPDIYLLAVKKLKLKPKECLAFEDTQYGLESAKSAGLTCFAIPSEFSKKQDFSKADKIFKNLKEIIKWSEN